MNALIAETQINRLRARRIELGWTQSRVISALETQARFSGVRIAERSSLKTMLSRWENGVGHPDGVYQRLFCLIFERGEDDLGFANEANLRRDRRPPVAPVLDEKTVQYFQEVFDAHVRADNLMGPHHLVEVTRCQTALLDRILTEPSGSAGSQLLRLACRYNEFTGWLCQDAGDVSKAIFFTDRAMDHSIAIGDRNSTGYLLMRKSNIANDASDPRRALSFTDAALRDERSLSPRINAMLLNQRARAYAAMKDAEQCARSIDAAYEKVMSAETPADTAAAYCTPEYIQMESAARWTEIGRPERAVEVFRSALAEWPTHQRRDLGLCQSRLAIAHARSGDVDSACAVGAEAVATAKAATSARTLRHLAQLDNNLAGWRRNEEVSALTGQIRQLTRAT